MGAPQIVDSPPPQTTSRERILPDMRYLQLADAVPRSRGGEHTWRNVVAACRRCNTCKGCRTPKEAGLQLRRNPRVPPRDSWVAAALGGMPDAEWAPYLKV